MNLEPPERCPVCSTASLLERVEIVATPLKRSEPREDNVIWLCPSCHYELDRGSLQGFEFESVLARLMKASGQFETDSVVQDAIVVGIDRQKRIDSVMQPISSSWNAKNYAEKIGKDHALGMVHDLNEDRGFSESL